MAAKSRRTVGSRWIRPRYTLTITDRNVMRKISRVSIRSRSVPFEDSFCYRANRRDRRYLFEIIQRARGQALTSKAREGSTLFNVRENVASARILPVLGMTREYG